VRYQLYDAALVKRLRNGIRERARTSRSKASGGKWWGARGGKGRYLWILWLVSIFGRGLANKSQADVGGKAWLFGCASVLFAAIVLTQARKLKEKLTVSVERAVTYFYPMEEKEFREWAVLRFAAGLWWLLALAGIIFGITEYGTDGTWIAACLAAVAECLLVACLIFLLEPYVDMVPRWLPLGFYALAALLYVAPGQYANAVQPMLSILPTGWIRYLLADGRLSEWRNWSLAATVLVLFVAAYFAMKELFRKLGQVTEMAEIGGQLLDLQQMVSGTNLDGQQENQSRDDDAATSTIRESGEIKGLPLQATWQREYRERVGVAWAEYVSGGDWLKSWNWEKASWLERAAGWTLSEKEKWTAEFLLGGQAPNWSNRWRVAVIATACAFVSLLSENQTFQLLALLGTAVSVGAGVPLLGGMWPAMGQGTVSGKLSPIHSCFPLDYRRAGGVMWKVNLVRTVVWTPLGLILGVLLGHNANARLTDSVWMAVRIIAVFLALSPILMAGKFSKSTNDSVNLRWSRVFVLVFAALLAMALIVGAFWAIVSRGWESAVMVAIVGAAAWGCWAFYGWYYERREVDLLREREN
jgi:hypothetical protein